MLTVNDLMPFEKSKWEKRSRKKCKMSSKKFRSFCDFFFVRCVFVISFRWQTNWKWKNGWGLYGKNDVICNSLFNDYGNILQQKCKSHWFLNKLMVFLIRKKFPLSRTSSKNFCGWFLFLLFLLWLFLIFPPSLDFDLFLSRDIFIVVWHQWFLNAVFQPYSLLKASFYQSTSFRFIFICGCGKLNCTKRGEYILH